MAQGSHAYAPEAGRTRSKVSPMQSRASAEAADPIFQTGRKVWRVEQARRKRRLKHGGGLNRIDLDSECALAETSSVDVLDLDEALTKLAVDEPSKADLVKLRFFAGLTMPEAAAALGISLATAERYWTFARAWLYSELADDAAPPR